jgi:hypothetical protein
VKFLKSVPEEREVMLEVLNWWLSLLKFKMWLEI